MFLRKATQEYSRRVRANDHLTPAELGLVRAILAGNTTGVALRQALVLAHGTIATHLESIYKKTGADNRADIVLMALGMKACQIDLVTQVLDASGQLRDVPKRDKPRKR